MRGKLGDVEMTEQQVRQIAQKYVSDNSLDKCSIEAVRRTKRSEIEQSTDGDEWVVQFRFDCDEEEGVFANRAIVIIDDATGEPHFLENL